MQYGMIPYTAIRKGKAVRFDVGRVGQMMQGVELPPDYQRKSWVDTFPESFSMAAEEKEQMVAGG